MRLFTSFLALLIVSPYLYVAEACSAYYSVKYGDICYTIAQNNGLTLDTFLSFNPNINCYNLQLGQQVCISAGSGNDNSGSCSKYYTVISGDICWNIALRSGLTLDQLLSYNPGLNCYALQIGQQICLSKGSSPSPSPDPNPEPTPDPDPTPSPNSLVTYQEFAKAVTACGYPTPSNTLYTSFVSRAPNDGGITTKRELAMFLAEILHESGGLIYKREIRCQNDGCPYDYRTPGDPAGVYYYGRGFIQLTWSYNYRAASYALFGDDRLVRNPDLVAQSDDYSWAVSFWFWKANVHSNVQTGQFGSATRAINGGLECSPCRAACPTRFSYYSKILPIFGVYETPNSAGC